MRAFKRREIYSNPEFQSALVRLGIWAFAVVYVSVGALSERYAVDIQKFITLFAVYLLFFSGLMISVFMRPVWEERRYFSLVVDISATTFCIFLTGEAASPFFLLYIWIFVSYGTRYGQRHLMTASALSILAYSVVLTLLGQWGKYLFEASFVLLVLGLLPMYQYSLMSKLHLARVQAEDSNRLMGRFLSNMTNDMRAPLGGMIVSLNELADSGLNMRELDKVEEISSSASLLDAVLGDVLDFSKMEVQQLQIQSVPFNLQDLMSEICLATSQCAFINKTELVCSISSDAPKVVVGDEQRLRQVLINLVKNAIDNSSNAELKVGVRVDDSGPDTLLFEIEGPALPLPDVEAETIDNDLRSNDLGVSMARKLVLMMGGEFGSVQGEDGSVFWFRLPVVVNDFESVQVKKFSSLDGKKVFVFETNNSSRQAITKSCEDAGMIVESVDKIGALGDAISQSRAKHDIDVILIADSLGGRDVARIADVCLDALGQDLPLVVLACRRNSLDLDKYKSATLIKKPYVLGHLMDIIQEVLATGMGEDRSLLSTSPVVDGGEQPTQSL